MLYVVFIICALISTIIFCAICVPEKFNQGISYIIESKYFLDEYQAKVENLNLRIEKGKLEIGQLTLENLGGKVVLQKVNINYNLVDIFRGVINSTVNINSIDVIAKPSKIKTKDNSNNILKLANLNLDLTFNLFTRETNIVAEVKEFGSAKIKISPEILEINDCKYFKADSLVLNVVLQIKNDNRGNIKSLLTAGSIDGEFAFDSRFLAFIPLEEHNKALFCDFAMIGRITNAIWRVDLDSNFFQSYKLEEQKKVLAKIKFNNSFIQYNPDFPTVDNISASIKLDSKDLKVTFDKGNIKDSKLFNSKISINLEDILNLKMLVSGKAIGPADNLLLFIPNQDKKNIDELVKLRNVKGKATTFFNILVPLDMDVPNSYDVKTKISSGALEIIGINYDSLKIDGFMNDDVLKLNFTGKIYKQNVNTEYLFTINDNIPFKHRINAKVALQPFNFKQYEYLTLTDGSAYAEASLDLGKSGSDHKLVINANFNNAGLILKKIGFVKNAKEKLEIKSSGIISDPNNFKLNFEAQGINNLHVKGSAQLINNDINWFIEKCIYLQNDFTASIFTKDGVRNSVFKGDTLDLSSNIELKEFLTKKSKKPGNIEIDVKKIVLKSDVELENFVLSLACDETKCNKGDMSSRIKNDAKNPNKEKNLTLKLIPMNNYEEWIINCDDIGLLLKGVGLYTKVNGGYGTITMQTSRKNTDLGEMLSLIDGNFKIDDFFITDVGLLTRIVSFLSFPGLLNSITKNPEVPFGYIVGTFSFKDDVFKFTRASADGEYFELTAQGEIDTNKKTVKISGTVVPALFGVNLLVRKLPLIGKILSGGHRKGVLFAPFFFKESYE